MQILYAPAPWAGRAILDEGFLTQAQEILDCAPEVGEKQYSLHEGGGFCLEPSPTWHANQTIYCCCCCCCCCCLDCWESSLVFGVFFLTVINFQLNIC